MKWDQQTPIEAGGRVKQTENEKQNKDRITEKIYVVLKRVVKY